MLFDSEQRHLVAAPNGGGTYTVIAGVNQWGVPIADITSYAFNTDGHGARLDMDGVDAYGFSLCHIGRSPDAEYVENEFQLFHLYQRLQKDSCGFGKYRGGSGTTTAYVIHHVPWAVMTCLSVNLTIVSNVGLFGGYAPAARPGIQVTNTNLWEKMGRGDKDIPTDTVELVTRRSIKGDYTIENLQRPQRPLSNGDIFTDISCAGAGYGDILEREPQMIMEDLRNEIISHWVAQNVYHVAYDPVTLEVNYEKTRELRQNELGSRKSRGKKYDNFVKGWSQKRPAEEASKHWGSWPDAQPVRNIMRI